MSEQINDRVDVKADKEVAEHTDDEDSASDSASLESTSSDSLVASSGAENSDKSEELGGEFIEESDKGCLEKTPSIVSHHKAIMKWEESAVAMASQILNLSPKARRQQAERSTQHSWGHSKTARDAEQSHWQAKFFPRHKVGSQFSSEFPESQNLWDGANARPRATSLWVPRSSTLDENEQFDEEIKVAPILRSVTEGPRKTMETTKVKKIKSKNQKLYINNYMLLQRIGRGASGTVRKCKDITTGLSYAMKVLNKTNLSQQLRFKRTENNAIERSSALDDIWREIAIMKKLSHKNIVNLVEVIESEKMVYLVLEYMPDGSIGESSTSIQKIEDEDVLRLWVRDMVAGLAYLHSQRICHSDIKPENILIGKDGFLKLADFGLSKFLREGQSRRIFDNKEGTPAFQAPECLNDSDDHKFSLFPTDVWALGVTIYQLKYGELPFISRDEEDLTKKIKRDPVELPEDEDEILVDLLNRMLTKDPSKRITVKELCYHPWITKNGQLNVLQSTFELESVSATERSHAMRKYVSLNSRDEEQPQDLLNWTRNNTARMSTSRISKLPPTNEEQEVDWRYEDRNDEKATLKPSVLKSASLGGLFQEQDEKENKSQRLPILLKKGDLSAKNNLSQNKGKNVSFSSLVKVARCPSSANKGSQITSLRARCYSLDDKKEVGDRQYYRNASGDDFGLRDSGANQPNGIMKPSRITSDDTGSKGNLFGHKLV